MADRGDDHATRVDAGPRGWDLVAADGTSVLLHDGWGTVDLGGAARPAPPAGPPAARADAELVRCPDRESTEPESGARAPRALVCQHPATGGRPRVTAARSRAIRSARPANQRAVYGV